MGAAVADGQKRAQAQLLQRGPVIDLRFDRLQDRPRELPRFIQLRFVRAGKAACQLRLPAAAQREFFLIRAAIYALERRKKAVLAKLRRGARIKGAGRAFQLQCRLDRLAVELLAGKDIPLAAPADADDIAAVDAGEISCFQIGVVRKDDICLYLRFHHPKVPSPALPGLI